MSLVAGDTDEPIYSTEGHQVTVWMLDDKGNTWQEDAYEGYGVFGGKDFYELLAEMNGLELTGDAQKDRMLGIDLAFKDSGSGEETEGVKYPRFTTDHKISYEKLPNPRSHSGQGWFEERDEEDDWDDWDDWDDYDDRDDEFESKTNEDDATEKCGVKTKGTAYASDADKKKGQI